MKLFHFFSFITLTLAALLPGSMPAQAAKEEGKFHLVYLVSTDRVEAGAKAFVEPLFFSDGREIKSLYEYCRATHRREEERLLPASKIGDEIRPVKDYCGNRPVSISGASYLSLNSFGSTIALGDVTFETNQRIGSGFVAPILPDSGIASVTSVSVSSAERILDRSGNTAQPKFFLMSANEKLLRQLLRITSSEDKELKSLLERAAVLSEKAKGVREYSARKVFPVSPRFRNSKPFLVAPIFSDVDGDGQLDLIVGMRAEASHSKSLVDYVTWVAVGTLLSTGEVLIRGDIYDELSGFTKRGASPDTPLALIHVNRCKLLLKISPPFDALVAESQPTETSDCRNQYSPKFLTPALLGPG